MLTQIPVIESERVILRDHRLADFDDYCALWTDPQVTRFIGGKARSRDDSWIRFLRHAGMWHHLGFGFWAIEEKATGRMIGECGFHELKRAIVPSLENTLEAGWTLLPDMQGKGYATEAVTLALRWAAENHPDVPVTCIIDPENEASLHLARKLGFVERARADFGGPVIIHDYRPAASTGRSR